MSISLWTIFFWISVAAAPAAATVCPLDCNGNGTVAPHERRQLPDSLFAGGACAAADVNGDAGLSAADVVALQAALFAMDDACLTPGSEWSELAPLAAGARQEVGVAGLDGIVYVVAGFEAPFAGQSARVEAYDVATDTWRTRAPLPRSAHHVATAVYAGKLYAVGGLTSLRFDPRREVYRYDVEADRWDEVAPLITARGALALAGLPDGLHAVAGFAAGAEVADHAVYDAATNQWSERAPLPTARDHLAAAVVGDRLYVVGGRTPNSNALHRYDAASDTWVPLAPMPTARSGHAAAAIDGKLVVLGGEVNVDNPPNQVFVEVELYDPETDRWVSLAPMPVPRHGMGAAVWDGRVIVPGGAFRAGFGASARNDALRLVW